MCANQQLINALSTILTKSVSVKYTLKVIINNKVIINIINSLIKQVNNCDAFTVTESVQLSNIIFFLLIRILKTKF